MAVRENTVVVKGYKELLQAFAHTEADVNKGMRGVLKEVGEIVRVDAAARMSHYDGRSAAGFRTVVSQLGVDVRQSIRGKHIRPQFGGVQMKRALLPALDAKSGETVAAFEVFLDRVLVKNF